MAEPDEGLALLAAIPETAAEAYQPFHAVRADLLRRLGARGGGRGGLCAGHRALADPAVRQFLWSRMAEQP